jgi:ASC-1-like (ASCH) protein
MEDIRETGPVGLKGINTKQQETLESIDLKALGVSLAGRTPSYANIGVDIPIYSSTGDLGTSRFDKEGGLTAEDISDVENMRAEIQSTLGKWVNGISKGGVLAGTTFLDGTLGLLWGASEMIASAIKGDDSSWETFSKLWDNEFSNGMAKINEWSEKALPNYRTKEERDRNWYQNLGTANFWADTFLKNMGFTVGAFASGTTFTKMMKGAGLIKTGLGAAAAGSIYGAINEARVEANHSSTDFYKKEQANIEQSYKAEFDDIWNNGYLDTEQKNQLTEELNNKYQAIQEDLDIRKSKMGLGTFIGNAVFLSINDFFTMGRMYAKGFQNAKRSGKSIKATADDLYASDQSISKYVTRQGDKWIADNISKGKAIGKGVTKGLLEGNEEMAQRFMAGTSAEWFNTDSPDAYINASLDSDAIIETDEFLDAAIKGWRDSYGNLDAYEEFAVGFLTGALGIPTFGRVQNSDASTILGRGKPVGISGGILGELAMAKSANKEMNEAVAFMNKYEQKLKTNKEHFVRSQAFTNAMSGWSEANNAFEYKNMEDNDDFVAISRYAAMGKLDYLKALVNQDFENISDETLQAIARETSTDTSGWYAVDGTYTPDGEEGASEMRKELIKKRDQILAQIANYETAVRETRSIANESLTDDQLNELAWLHWKATRFKERYTQMKEDFPTFYQALSENLNDWEEALNTLNEDGELSKDLQDVKKTVSVVKQFIDKINTSKDLMYISTFIDTNKSLLDFIDSKDFYDAFGEHSTLSEPDFRKVITNLRDIAKIANAYKTFNQRYKEFVDNPTKINKNRKKLFAKKEAEQKAINKNKTVSEIDNLSTTELVKKVKEGDVDLETLKSFAGLENVDEDANIPNETIQKIQEVESIITTIEDGKAEAMRMFQNGEMGDQEFQDTIALIEAAGESAEFANQVLDPDIESALNPDVLENIPGEEFLSDVERADFKEERLERARGKINFIRSNIANREQGITEQPTTSSETPTTGHDATPTTETIQENKARKEAEINRNKELKTILEKVDALIFAEDKIPVRAAVIRMYDTAKNLFNNDLSAEDIFEVLRKTPQYETAKKYPKVLQVIKDFVESLYNPKTTVPKSEISFDDIADQEVVVSHNENVEQQNKAIKNQKTGENASNYWQPSTTQFPIYRQDGVRVPFYEVAKNLKKEDGSPRYTPEQLKSMEARYKYLESKGTFDIRNSQKLAVKDTVHFVIDPTLNQTAGEVVILMVDSKGNVIGDLVSPTYDSSTKHQDLIETITAIEQEYKDWLNAGNTGLFTSQKYKSQIAQLMVGHVEYSDDRHSLNEIFTVTTSSGATKQLPFKIAVIVVDKKGVYKMTTTSESGALKGDDPIGASAIKPLKAKKGQPFLLIPTNDPKRAYMPVSFVMPYYHRGTSKSTLGTIIDSILEDIRTIDSSAAASSVSKRLAEHLGKAWRGDDGKLKTSFHINRKSVFVDTSSTDAELRSGIVNKEQRTLISISYIPEKGAKAAFTIEIDPNDPEAINKLKNKMFEHQIPFRINRKYLNKKIGNVEYNQVIGELANTNVEPGFVTTTNNWFTIAPVNVDGTVQKADIIKTTKVNPTTNTAQPTTPTKIAVEYNGRTLFVDEQWNVTDETGKSYTKGENTLKFLGYAWGVIKGEDMTKPYNTEWGMYDPVKKNYIPVEQPKQPEQGPALLYGGELAQEALPLHNPATGEAFPVRVGLPKNRFQSITLSTEKDDLVLNIVSATGKKFTVKYVRSEKEGQVTYTLTGGALYGIRITPSDIGLTMDEFIGTRNDYNSDEGYQDSIELAADGLIVSKFYISPNGTVNVETEGGITPLNTTHKKIVDYIMSAFASVQETAPQIQEAQQLSKEELIASLRSKGFLGTPKAQNMVEFLTEEDLNKVLSLNDAIIRQVIQKLTSLFDTKTGKFKKDIKSIIYVDRNREAIGEYKTFDRESELKWLESVLPQFKDRVQLVEGLIKIVNGVNSDRAFGKFVNGHIILSDVAAEGTVYHEAFHAVVNTLLNESELLDLLNEGRKQFGLTDDIAVEEKLAEGFRRYIQIEQGFGGNIVKAFRRIRHYMKNIRGKESVIHRLYFDISQGYYADKKLYETEVSRNREVNLDNFSLEELKELKSYLDSKQYQEIHPNRTAVVDYVVSNPMLKKAYELGLLKDVKHRKDKDARRIVPKTTELNKLIRAKRKGETNHVVDITIDREDSVYRPNLTREQQISEAALAWQERDLDYFDEIADYHTYKLNYNYLSLEDKQYVDSTGISEEQWNKLQNKVKEAILHCK